MDFFGILFDMKNGKKIPYSRNFFDTLFAQKLEELGVKTITGTLPLTFTAKAGAADTWTVYGNDNGTEQLFDGNYQATFINTNTNKYSALNEGRTAVIQCDPNTQYTISAWSGCNRLVVGEFETEPQINDTANILASYTATIPQHITITTGANVHYIACYVSNQNNEPTISIVKGSTAPDHYIPYQKGVGERTANLVEGVIEGSNIDGNGVIVSNTSFNMCVAKIVEGREYTITTSASSGFVYGLFSALPTISSQSYDNSRVIGQRTFTAPIDGYIAFRATLDDTLVMLTEGSTAPDHFIPYGYEIPLIVSQDGQTDKNYDIYIGDSPLTEGETVSKQSTGVDLELFEGENTVSTTLYNKPTMTITYK